MQQANKADLYNYDMMCKGQSNKNRNSFASRKPLVIPVSTGWTMHRAWHLLAQTTAFFITGALKGFETQGGHTIKTDDSSFLLYYSKIQQTFWFKFREVHKHTMSISLDSHILNSDSVKLWLKINFFFFEPHGGTPKFNFSLIRLSATHRSPLDSSFLPNIFSDFIKTDFLGSHLFHCRT